MGQLIFVGNSGGAGAGTHGVFLEDLYSSGASFTAYGFAATGGQAFYPADNFSITAAFRVVQENTAESVISILSCTDNAGVSYELLINGGNLISADIAGSVIDPGSCDIPLGRVFIVTLTHTDAGENILYINGRNVGTVSQTLAAVTLPVSFLIGATATWDKDFIEYIGFAWIDVTLTPEQVADVFLASQDAGKVVIPANYQSENDVGIFNAVSGLSDITLWVPEVNTMTAPDLPEILTGPHGSGSLKTAPIHMAHSGWATPVVVP